MDFTVEFYETREAKRPVQEFLDELKASDPDDFAGRSTTETLVVRKNPFMLREPQHERDGVIVIQVLSRSS